MSNPKTWQYQWAGWTVNQRRKFLESLFISTEEFLDEDVKKMNHELAEKLLEKNVKPKRELGSLPPRPFTPHAKGQWNKKNTRRKGR